MLAASVSGWHVPVLGDSEASAISSSPVFLGHGGSTFTPPIPYVEPFHTPEYSCASSWLGGSRNRIVCQTPAATAQLFDNAVVRWFWSNHQLDGTLRIDCANHLLRAPSAVGRTRRTPPCAPHHAQNRQTPMPGIYISVPPGFGGRYLIAKG